MKKLKCNICNKHFHHSWLKSWNRWNMHKRPMTKDKFVCLSCVVKKQYKTTKICGWSDE